MLSVVLQTDLQLIHSSKHRFHASVCHRESEIKENSSPRQRRHVSGKLNPNDDCSRCIPALELTESHWWFAGARFLRKTDDAWPATDLISEPAITNPEIAVPRRVEKLSVDVFCCILYILYIFYNYCLWIYLSLVFKFDNNQTNRGLGSFIKFVIL